MIFDGGVGNDVNASVEISGILGAENETCFFFKRKQTSVKRGGTKVIPEHL